MYLFKMRKHFGLNLGLMRRLQHFYWKRIFGKQLFCKRLGYSCMRLWHDKIMYPPVLSKILETPQTKCNRKSEIEIHSLLCHKHIHMYLLAIKSFLRFYNNVAVVVHDDGTLREKDIITLKEHIENLKVIKKKEADRAINKILKNKPNCRYFREIYPIAKQVFDYKILASKNKVISFDSDIIFFRRPEEIIKWLDKKNRYILYNQQKECELPHNKVFKKYKINQLEDLNGGFVCYYKDAVNLGHIERTIKKLENQKEYYLWAQAFLGLTFYESSYHAKPLDKNKYIVLDKAVRKSKSFIKKNPVMIHFINYRGYSIGRFHGGYYSKYAKKVIKELMNPTT